LGAVLRAAARHEVRLDAVDVDDELDDERQLGQRAVKQTAICSHQPRARRS
jgi:hypothetical protein